MAKILVAKVGLDSHWRGALTVARHLRNQGHEVVFIGNQTPEAIVKAALQEDVDLIGLSTLSGNHLVYVPEVMDFLQAQGGSDIPVILGGTIPAKDRRSMEDCGIKAIFGPGEPMERISDFIKTILARE